MDITNFVDCMSREELIEFASRGLNLDNSYTNFINNDGYQNTTNQNTTNQNNILETDENTSENAGEEYIEDNRKVCIYYDEDEEIYNEQLSNEYHYEKSFGNWHTAKMIVSHTYSLYTEFLWDYLDMQFQANNDDFNNIIKVYYKNNFDIGIVYEFENVIAKYLVDNIKIQSFKPRGYIFNTDENQNLWNFKIVVITTKGVYCANRYITDNIIGCY